MTNSSIFNIDTASVYFNELVLPQYDDFLKNNASSRYALPSIMSSHHLYEWVNGRKFTVNDFKLRYPDYSHLSEYFELARKLTNGTKHCANKVNTKVQTGFSSAFSLGFSKPLIVERDDGSYVSVDELLSSIIGFWKQQQNLIKL
ncbi:hypothetical protein [Aliivibrio fischeri]|uniref:hypothetical protein n=1 Tax=Aliivibrio fischeri TaxID=668 RepID=UPI0007C56AE8|nr:hypothetical protein [Aliivibrio fischeri]